MCVYVCLRESELSHESDTDVLTCFFLDQFDRGGQCDWSEDGFLCPASFLCLNRCCVTATQEGYRGGVA